jgi:hypothetical protein
MPGLGPTVPEGREHNIFGRSETTNVANGRDRKDVDAEIDLHGLTVAQMRVLLQKRWPEWRGMRRVRVIHGRGEALKPELARWCDEMGIPCAVEPGNPGSSRIFPSLRTLHEPAIGATLREKWLHLTPEQQGYLRDPGAVLRSRQEELRGRQEEERRKAAAHAAHEARIHRDEALWQAEVARLDSLDRNRSRSGAAPDTGPGAPVILPRSQMKHEEGYWRAELVRVADTDTDTLKQQKRHGLDKLAPPLEPRAAGQPPRQKGTKRAAPSRDFEADKALFEAEMTRLKEADAVETRRARRR